MSAKGIIVVDSSDSSDEEPGREVHVIEISDSPDAKSGSGGPPQSSPEAIQPRKKTRRQGAGGPAGVARPGPAEGSAGNPVEILSSPEGASDRPAGAPAAKTGSRPLKLQSLEAKDGEAESDELSPPSSPVIPPGDGFSPSPGPPAADGPVGHSDVSATAAPAAAASPGRTLSIKEENEDIGGSARPIVARQQVLVAVAALGPLPPMTFHDFTDALPTKLYNPELESVTHVEVQAPVELTDEDHKKLSDSSIEFLDSSVITRLLELLKAEQGDDSTSVVLSSYATHNIENFIMGKTQKATAISAVRAEEWKRATRLVLPLNRGNRHWYCMNVPIGPAPQGDIIVYDSLIRAEDQRPSVRGLPAMDREYRRWCTYARAYVYAMNAYYKTAHAVSSRYSLCRGPTQKDGYTCALMTFFAIRYFVAGTEMPRLPREDRAAGPALKRIARAQLGRIVPVAAGAYAKKPRITKARRDLYEAEQARLDEPPRSLVKGSPEYVAEYDKLQSAIDSIDAELEARGAAMEALRLAAAGREERAIAVYGERSLGSMAAAFVDLDLSR